MEWGTLFNSTVCCRGVGPLQRSPSPFLPLTWLHPVAGKEDLSGQSKRHYQTDMCEGSEDLGTRLVLSQSQAALRRKSTFE